jgi:hypothetical protein
MIGFGNCKICCSNDALKTARRYTEIKGLKDKTGKPATLRKALIKHRCHFKVAAYK